MPLNHHRIGSGEPLVLIHGIGSRWQVWDPVLPALAAHRDVVALDLPGFAGSPAPPDPPGVPTLARLVGEFLDELGLDRPHAAGNSLGGWVALELAKQGRVRSATALSPAGFQNSTEAVFQHSSMWLTVRLSRLVAPRADRLLARPRLRAALLWQFAARPERMPGPDAAASLRALAGAAWFDQTLPAINRDRFAGGERIDVPVLIAWAEHDRLLAPRQADRAAAAIPTAQVTVLSGCGHVPTYDDPEQVARVLLEGSSD